MITFLKTAAAILAITLIVPLAVWGGTGSLRHAWFAYKRFLLIMGGMLALALLVSGITLLPHLIG